MNIKELITFWVPFAIAVVICRRILDYGFTVNVFKSGFVVELFTGIIVCLVVVILAERKKKKRK